MTARRACWSLVALVGAAGGLPAQEPVPYRDPTRPVKKLEGFELMVGSSSTELQSITLTVVGP